MSGFFDLYSIIFLIIAVVIFMRLGSVLGRRTGNEPGAFDQANKPGQAKPAARANGHDNIVSLPPRDGPAAQSNTGEVNEEIIAKHAKAGTPLYDGLLSVAKADPMFDPVEFISGAKMAYEMIVLAFADGDRTTLENLLAKDVFDGFVAAISEREERGERVDSTFIGIEDSRFTEAEMDGSMARIAVRFTSEIISVTKNTDGAVIEGDPTSVQTVRDIWTFSRDVSTPDPNWKLVATEAV